MVRLAQREDLLVQRLLRVRVLDQVPLVVRLDGDGESGLPVAGALDLGEGPRPDLDAHLEVLQTEWLLAGRRLLALLDRAHEVQEFPLRVPGVLREGDRVNKRRPLLLRLVLRARLRVDLWKDQGLLFGGCVLGLRLVLDRGH